MFRSASGSLGVGSVELTGPGAFFSDRKMRSTRSCCARHQEN